VNKRNIANLDWLRSSEAASLVGVSRKTIWDWAKRGVIESRTTGDAGWMLEVKKTDVQRMRRELNARQASGYKRMFPSRLESKT